MQLIIDNYMRILTILFTLALLVSCSSNNCPLENKVSCNYHFYDCEGNAIFFLVFLIFKTLKPGYKKEYTYRKLGEQSIVTDVQTPEYVELGYTETVQEVRNATILLNKSNTLTSVKLPMSYNYTADTLVFHYGSILAKDTVILQHTPYPYVEMPECGSYMFHVLTGIRSTEAGIDRVEIANPTVNYEGQENVKIYFNGVAE